MPGNIHPVIYINEKPTKSSQLPGLSNKLFHYCNKQGFEGIVKLNSLWLSTLRKTNDELSFTIK